MPPKTAGQLKDKVATLRKKLQEKGTKLDAAGVRELKKRIRRAQRKGRSLAATVASRSGAAKKKEE